MHLFIYFFSVCVYIQQGGTWIWKWRASAYQRMKVAVYGVIFCWKKGVIQSGLKKMGSFWCGLPKMGVMKCAKMPFQAQICIFYVNIYCKICKFLKMHAKHTQICNLYVKFDTMEKKGVIGCGLSKKGCHWV